ncbi:MAG TPA: MCP four helix bundle domain-containing protein [Vicinamibacterales bacterium]|nr:MCP four helix bundle domain-containing protein [Vicinamibacterales bacterium]
MTSFLRRAAGLIAWGRHLTAMLVIVGVAVLGVGLIVVRDPRSSNRQARTMYESSMAGLDLLNQLQYLTQEARRSVLYALGTSDTNRQVEYADQSRAADAQVAGIIARHIQRTSSPSARQAADRFTEDWRAYLAVRDRVISAILEGSNKEATDTDLATASRPSTGCATISARSRSCTNSRPASRSARSSGRRTTRSTRSC